MAFGQHNRCCEMRRMMILLVLVLVLVLQVQGQQYYVNNKQLDCYNHYNTTDGYVCNGVASACLSYLTFRSAPPYNSPTAIAYLLGSEPTAIAAANNVSDVDTFPTHTPVIVPVNCSCAGNLSSGSGYYQHNASYVLKNSSDTYLGVANNTYQGLTTCQSLMAQNPYDDKNLKVGMSFQVPVRCACPTQNQTDAGFNFLLAYLVIWGDDPSSIAQRFGLDLPTLLQANRLSSGDTIYPFTPILVPLTTPPSPLQLQLPSPSPPPASPTASPTSSKNNNLKWALVGVALAAVCLLLIALLVFFLVLPRRRRQRSSKLKLESAVNSTGANGKSLDFMPTSTSLPSDTKSSWSISSPGLRCAVESLTLYKLEDLQRATGFFSEANKIKGSCTVFRATFQGDDAAVKVMKGDVSSEINILKRINHSNIIRLSGFCVHQGDTYLVYEYAHCGSLSDCLHHHSQSHNLNPNPLPWKQRIQIAHDVADALNYLHNFTDPPCIHKDLKSSNILLDAKLRAKVSNFGLARAVDNPEQEEEGGGFQLTRHVVGTQGYMAPEYIENGVITPKLDVFAFGVVLLELLSGREATAANDRKGGGSGEESLLSASISGVLEGDHVRDKLKEFIDPALNGEYPLDLAFSMAQLAKTCVAPQINLRPTMSQAFITLSMILSSTLDWDPSDADDLHRSSTSLSHRR